MKKQRTKKAFAAPLTEQELTLIFAILDKLNVLLAKRVLDVKADEEAQEFKLMLKLKLRKDGKEFVVTEQKQSNLELNKQFFSELCHLLQKFIDLNGLGVDWHKRRADQVLRSMRSLEAYYGN